MELFYKHFTASFIVVAVVFGMHWSASANVSDDLYSESIYIQKSSAEIPGSLESNARGGTDTAIALENEGLKAIESISDLDSEPVGKRIGKSRGVKKSASN